MKFQVRDGFVCKLVTKIDLGDGKTEQQENTIFAGQTVDMTAEQAELHAHKLEPKDAKAEAFLAAKVMPAAPGAAVGLTAEALALVQAMAAELAKQIVASMAPTAKVATPAT